MREGGRRAERRVGVFEQREGKTEGGSGLGGNGHGSIGQILTLALAHSTWANQIYIREISGADLS